MKKVLGIALVLALAVMLIPSAAFAADPVDITFSGVDGKFEVTSSFEKPLVNYVGNFAPFGYTGGVVDQAKVEAASFAGAYSFAKSGSSFETTFSNGTANWLSAIANNEEMYSISYQPKYYQNPGILRQGELVSNGSGYVSRLESYVGSVSYPDLTTSDLQLSAGSNYSGYTFLGEADLMSSSTWTSTTYSKINFSGSGNFGLLVDADRTNQWGIQDPPVTGFYDRGRIALLVQEFAVSATGSGNLKNTVDGGPATVSYGTRTALGGYASTVLGVDTVLDTAYVQANNLAYIANYAFDSSLVGGGELWSNVLRHDATSHP